MDKLEKRKDGVLADGEVTGHAHTAIGENVEVYGNDIKRMLLAPKGCHVTHQEHKQIDLPAGKYVTDRVAQYDYDTEERKVVRD